MQKTIMIAAALLASFMISQRLYPEIGVVQNVSDDYVVTVETPDGNLFDYIEDADDTHRGAFMALMMDNSGTPDDPTDDKILNVKYCGTPDEFNK